MASSSSSGTSSSIDSNGTVVITTASPSTRTPAGTLTSKAMSTRQEDTCGCGPTARTCHECLNVILLNEDGCVVSPLGVCMSASNAAVLSFQQRTNTTPTEDLASNSNIVPQSNEFFSSTNTTYCDVSDAACATCRQQWIDGYQKDKLRSLDKFSCIGGGGCVCTAYCEIHSSSISLPTSYNYRQVDCSRGDLQPGGPKEFDVRRMINILAMLLGAIVLVFAVKWGVRGFQEDQHDRRLRAQRRAQQQQRNETTRSRIMLTLEGWTGYREQLIEREQASLGLKSDPLLTGAPTQVIVQEGEGFRPTSPSQMTT